MPCTPPDPAVTRAIAEEVLSRGGEFRANTGHLHGLFRRLIPDSPAAVSPAAAGKFVAWARSDLGAHGIAVRRDGPSQGPRRREWHFRLIAIPVETGTDAA